MVSPNVAPGARAVRWCRLSHRSALAAVLEAPLTFALEPPPATTALRRTHTHTHTAPRRHPFVPGPPPSPVAAAPRWVDCTLCLWSGVGRAPQARHAAPSHTPPMRRGPDPIVAAAPGPLSWWPAAAAATLRASHPCPTQRPHRQKRARTHGQTDTATPTRHQHTPLSPRAARLFRRLRRRRRGDGDGRASCGFEARALREPRGDAARLVADGAQPLPVEYGAEGRGAGGQGGQAREEEAVHDQQDGPGLGVGPPDRLQAAEAPLLRKAREWQDRPSLSAAAAAAAAAATRRTPARREAPPPPSSTAGAAAVARLVRLVLLGWAFCFESFAPDACVPAACVSACVPAACVATCMSAEGLRKGGVRRVQDAAQSTPSPAGCAGCAGKAAWRWAKRYGRGRVDGDMARSAARGSVHAS
mmetsp:Transcript_44075/g.122134  ORF Transcript_44075/g.122134 Transcript_44075/m.122134 type:complete len:416 (+) Transcript_44075:453-1700(+)